MARGQSREEIALAAAILAARGMRQTEIAAKLNISQPEVSRLLAQAKKREWLRQTPSLVPARIDAQLLDLVQRKFFFRPKLASRIQGWAPRGVTCTLHVVHAKSEKDFGLAVAEIVADLVKRSRHLGVTWGRSIAALVDGLEQILPEPPRRKDPIDLVPLCGDPVFAAMGGELEYSSSYVVRRLARLLNGTKYDGALLNGVPVYIPTRFNATEMKAVRKFIGMIVGYEKIYGKKGKIHAIDSMLTGIGVLNHTERDGNRRGVFLEERMKLEEMKPKELDRLVYGEIGGVLIERAKLNATDRRRVEELNKGWMGFTEEQLRDCSAAAKSGDGGCGVVVVASGAFKAPLLREAIRRGLVNELVIDDLLASALEAEI